MNNENVRLKIYKWAGIYRTGTLPRVHIDRKPVYVRIKNKKVVADIKNYPMHRYSNTL
jgi:hypothetical protein